MRYIICALLFVSCLQFVAPSVYAVDERELLMEEAQNLNQNKKYDESIVIYRRLAEKNPNDVEAAVWQARVTSWMGDYEGAEALYRNVLEKNPDNVEALLGLSSVYFWQGRNDESVETLNKALAIAPDNVEALELKEKIERAEEGDKRFKIRAGFSYQDISFTSNAPGANFLVSYNEAKKWGVRAGFDYVNKYGDSAPGYRAGGNYWPTDSTNLSLDIEFAPKQVVVPKQAYTFEIDQDIYDVVTLSLGYRFADYEAADVHMVMPGVTWYFYPRFDLMAKYFFSISRFGDKNHINNSAMARLTWNAVDPLVLFAGYAYDSESFDSGNPIDPYGAFTANHVFAGIRWEFYKGVGLDFDYDYERRNNGFTIHTYNAGMFYRF